LPLPILVAVVGIGIAAIVIAVHLMGGTAVAEFTSSDEAIDRFRIDYPETNVVACHISRNRRDAVLELADGHVGLVHAIGSKYLTRSIRGGEMAARSTETGTVEIDTHDITWPRARMEFEDQETARGVAELIGSAGNTEEMRAA
jgi:hypothetical protein